MKMGSLSDDENVVLDGDLCGIKELKAQFHSPLYLASEEAITLKKSYILHLDVSRNFDKVVAASSQNCINVFDLRCNNDLFSLYQLDIKDLQVETICGVKFANIDSNLLFISTTSGKIYQQDLRVPNKEWEQFTLDENNNKPLTCFDINSNDSILCGGTEQASGESFLLFFDIRQRKTLGAYLDSHQDDLTQIKFHPTRHNVLTSGSTDGLINVFDISNSTEEDALQYCLNTESSVQTLNWHSTSNPDKNRISCITHTNDFHLYDVEESEEIVKFVRGDVTKAIQRKSSNECYLINCHTTNQGDVLLVAGSNYNKGECLRTLTLSGKELQPRNTLSDNKQIVRCSAYNEKDDALVTAGEGGIVTVWQSRPTSKASSGEKRKETVKHKDRKAKPY